MSIDRDWPRHQAERIIDAWLSGDNDKASREAESADDTAKQMARNMAALINHWTRRVRSDEIRLAQVPKNLQGVVHRRLQSVLRGEA